MIKSRYGTTELDGDSNEIYADLASIVQAVKTSGTISAEEIFECCLNSILVNSELIKTFKGSRKEILRMKTMSIEMKVADVMSMIAEEKKDDDRRYS